MNLYDIHSLFSQKVLKALHMFKVLRFEFLNALFIF